MEVMGKEERLAAEEASLAQAEAQHAAQFGTGTPAQPAETPAPQAAPAQAAAPATQEPAPARHEDESQVDWEKRYKDLQSHSDKRINTLLEQMKAAGVQEQEPDKLQAMQDEVAQLREFKRGMEVQQAVQKAQQAVREAHPDFEEIVPDPLFEEWIKTKPEVFQKAIYDEVPDAAMASSVLTLFKAETGLMGASMLQQDQAALQQQQALAAQAVSDGKRREAPDTKQKKVWTQAEINALSPSQYDSLEAEIDAAFAEGRIRF